MWKHCSIHHDYDSAAVAEPASYQDDGRRGDGGSYSFKPTAGATHMGNRPDGTRNLRNVWSIATSPTPFAHFATMPPDLAERCIKAGTSERGQCPHCAAPWARVVERERSARTFVGDGLGWDERKATGNGGSAGYSANVTTGWSPTCACPEHKPVPQTVLDPFAGAGTTLLCADRLGRNGIGIELNPAYAVMARNRLTDDCPLFADVAD
jgi:hypothetical protein